jgi:hypothetical protein
MEPTPLEKVRIRACAVGMYASDSVEIEDDAEVVATEDADWVAAWVRVPREQGVDEDDARPERVAFVYSKDAYYCELCVPETIDWSGDDLHVYEEGISDAGFTGYPRCAACGREHTWVGLSVRCALCGQDADARETHRHGPGFIGECCWDERLRGTE